MKKSELIAITGGLSNPSKMPGQAYSLPARECPVGSKLRLIPGSVCASCYACKGRYVFGNVQRALYRRLDAVRAALADRPGSAAWEAWLDAMVALIGTDLHFRFHDSGDLQSTAHLALYCALADRMPDISFWMPTKETQIVKRYGVDRIPSNLTVRLSASMVDASSTSGLMPGSVVWTRERVGEGIPPGYQLCPASTQGNACGDCRACWDSSVDVVVYPKH